MKAAFAYILVFILGPTVGALGALFLMPVTIAIGRATHPIAGGAVTGLAQTFLTAWAGIALFGWFGLKAGWGVIFVLGIGFLLNDLGRISSRSATPVEIGHLVGDISGLVLAAFLLLP